jgi:hypothetical protein
LAPDVTEELVRKLDRGDDLNLLEEMRILTKKIKMPGNTKEGSITVPLTSCLNGLDLYVLQIKTKFVSCHTTDSKLVKQEVNSTVILLPLVFPAQAHRTKPGPSFQV